MSTVHELNAERTSLTTRLLELDVQETEWSRLFHAQGIPTPMSVRATLAAERARIRLRLHNIGLQLREMKQQEPLAPLPQITA